MNLWKPILAALVIFAAGVVTGGLTVRIRQLRAPDPGNTQVKKQAGLPREGQLRELSRRMATVLDLTTQQRERIEAIIRDSQERTKTLRDEIGRKIREESREMRQKIRDELTPDQGKKFEQLMKQHDDRSKREERNSRPASSSAERPGQ